MPERRERAERMRRVNPSSSPRNHRVEEALAAASDDGDLGAVRAPARRVCATRTTRRAESARYAEPAAAEVTACYRTFCGT